MVKKHVRSGKVELYSFYADTELENPKKYGKGHSINHALLCDGVQEDIRNRFGVSGIPHLFLLKRNRRNQEYLVRLPIGYGGAAHQCNSGKSGQRNLRTPMKIHCTAT
ncbi:thioredoxin family protein [Marinilongibacter aquaticus]|uniref:thioredoxin family protein n=1 Tax=Marinilongibacter aquaticus TaxID=2975157 RepID=UPI0021BCFF89|nr:thioredoxin family protein [Marinilongibacter aquaticus]UBM60005.1 thioredoxin family protein [Marinilongibacter aquaticus]